MEKRELRIEQVRYGSEPEHQGTGAPWLRHPRRRGRMAVHESPGCERSASAARRHGCDQRDHLAPETCSLGNNRDCRSMGIADHLHAASLSEVEQTTELVWLAVVWAAR
jgi:hypothetical protein